MESVNEKLNPQSPESQPESACTLHGFRRVGTMQPAAPALTLIGSVTEPWLAAAGDAPLAFCCIVPTLRTPRIVGQP